jgi:hypothetical protein
MFGPAHTVWHAATIPNVGGSTEPLFDVLYAWLNRALIALAISTTKL